MLLMRSFSVMSMVFVGQLCSAEDFAAVSLATSLANVTGFSVLVGLSSGLATVAAQAYGAGDLDAMNQALRKALVVLLGACLPLSLLWYLALPLLMLLGGQEAAMSVAAHRYLQASIPR